MNKRDFYQCIPSRFLTIYTTVKNPATRQERSVRLESSSTDEECVACRRCFPFREMAEEPFHEIKEEVEEGEDTYLP